MRRMYEGALDYQYQQLIKSLRTLPWDEKPRRSVQSAITSLEGSINGKEVAFSWWQPGSYSRDYLFLGLLIMGDNNRFNELFDVTGREGMTDPSSVQSQNIQEFKNAIEYVRNL